MIFFSGECVLQAEHTGHRPIHSADSPEMHFKINGAHVKYIAWELPQLMNVSIQYTVPFTELLRVATLQARKHCTETASTKPTCMAANLRNSISDGFAQH